MHNIHSKFYEKKLNFIFYSLIILNIFYFFFGFYFQHDFSNGGKIDFTHIYNNFKLFKNNSIQDIPWENYESSSLPLHYLITRFVIPSDNIFIFKLYTFIISIFCFPLFYYLLKISLNEKNNNVSILLLSSILFISSSFRTDSFFGLEENIGFLLFFLTFIFFYKYQRKKLFLYKFLTILFSCIIFYSRQTYAFVPIITFFYFLDKKYFFCLKNLNLTFLYFLFLVPSLYFFINWGSLVPIEANSRIVSFKRDSIPIMFGMFIIYLLPLYFYHFLKIKKNLNFLKLKFLILFLILFTGYSYIFWDLRISQFGGGPLYKIFLSFNEFKLIYLFFSFLGVIFCIHLSLKNLNFLIFITFFVFVYSIADNHFFSYLDPLMIISIFVLSNFFNEYLKKDKFFSLFIFFYFISLHFSWLFYYKFIIGDVIR